MKDKVGKVIDNWRHKDYLRDNIGHLLAVNLTIVWCNITCHNISSFGGLGDNNPPWWLLRIVTGGWTNAGACCKELLDHINVLWAKVTHMRAAGMEDSSSREEEHII